MKFRWFCCIFDWQFNTVKPWLSSRRFFFATTVLEVNALCLDKKILSYYPPRLISCALMIPVYVSCCSQPIIFPCNLSSALVSGSSWPQAKTKAKFKLVPVTKHSIILLGLSSSLADTCPFRPRVKPMLERAQGTVPLYLRYRCSTKYNRGVYSDRGQQAAIETAKRAPTFRFVPIVLL